ncbi:MAG: ABC transporter permease [Acidobacteria bacterium]|nr:ABC transporter permease [Acidobacteriota bacterium]MCW5971310.1 ABC transporter permease [Blastocatellales bacterium]
MRSEWLENIWMALDTLRQHKLRSFLTVLGVVIGTMTVIVIAAFVSGIDDRVAKEIESFGTNSIYIFKFEPGFNFNPSPEERTRKPISYEDALAIAEECPSVEAVAPFMSPVDFLQGPMAERVKIRYRDTEMVNATVQGTLPAYFRMGTVDVSEGRFFTEMENSTRSDVCVIGRDVANTLYPNLQALGREVMINGRNYRVIGVLRVRDNFLTPAEDPGNENKAVYLPYETLRKIYPNVKENFVMAQARTGMMDRAVDEIRQVLRKRRNVPYGKPDNFGISTSKDILDQFAAITGGIFMLMVAISSVGLLIGGIGVMNIMLVSVTERTREIGVRKAIGARRQDIILQFLVEAATLTGLGGLLGILLGWGSAALVNLMLPTYVPLWAPIVGFCVSVALGVGFGLWPAWRAARLDPVEALRYE